MAQKHGMSGTSEFWTWWSMKQRCCNPNHAQWPNYGGRGITICKRWMNDFAAFFRDMGPRPPGMSLERKNNNRGYSPGNCVWATAAEQCNNHRRNRRMRVDGEWMTLRQAARLKGIHERTLLGRMEKGWPRSRLFIPSLSWVPRVRVDGEWMNIREAARIKGINENTLRARVRLGWPEDHLFVPAGSFRPGKLE